MLVVNKSAAPRPMKLRAWYKRPAHCSGCCSKEAPWGAKFVSSREFLQSVWRFDDRWTRLDQQVLGDDATADAERKPAEHEPTGCTGRVGPSGVTRPADAEVQR